MKIRAVAKLYNETIKARRKELGMNQAKYGEYLGGYSQLHVSMLETFRFPKTLEGKVWRLANAIADDCGCSIEEIFPHELCGYTLPKFENVAEVDHNMLAAGKSFKEIDMVSESDNRQDAIESAARAALSLLNHRERTIIEGRYGIGCKRRTLEEIGADFRICGARVRMIESRALRKMQQLSKAKKIIVEAQNHDNQYLNELIGEASEAEFFIEGDTIVERNSRKLLQGSSK